MRKFRLTNFHKIDILQSGNYRMAVKIFLRFQKEASSQKETILKYRQSQGQRFDTERTVDLRFLVGTMKNRTNNPTWIILPIALFFLFSCATTEQKQSESRNPKFYNNRGIAYGEKGQYDQAISDFNKAIEINPGYDKAYNNRGIIYRLKGQYDQAISDFNKAIEINPTDAQAYNNLAWLFATAKVPGFRNGKRAVELALKACELSEWKNPGYLDTLAASYARVGDFGNATKWQEKALQIFEEDRKAEAQKRLNLYRERKPWPSD